MKAIIKKMVNDERMLMVQGEATVDDDKILRVHPNYNGWGIWLLYVFVCAMEKKVEGGLFYIIDLK